jgi:hypothetical protein
MSKTNLSKHLCGICSLVCLICLFPLVPKAAEAQAILAGTWNFNSFVTGPGAPWFQRGTVTVAQNGTFTGSGTESNGKVDSISGSLAVSSAGLVMKLNGQSATAYCEIDSSYTFLSCTETLSNHSSNLFIMTNQATSCSLSDLAGTWQGAILSAGPTPLWERVTETINSDGTFTGSYTKSDGTTGVISGALAISSIGVITCVSGSCADPTYASVMNTGKTITVGLSGAATTTEDANLFVFAKQATSYSIDDLVSTWIGNGLASGRGAPWFEDDTLSIAQDGTTSFAWVASDGTSGNHTGTLSISSAGVITLNLSSTSIGFIDANMTVMVFTRTWGDGATQELGIFTNNPVVSPNVSSIISPTSSSGSAASAFSEPTSTSNAPSSSTGAPTTGPSGTGGGGTTPQGGGASTTDTSQSKDSTAAPTAAASEHTANRAPSSPPETKTPTAVPNAPTIIAATTGFGRPTAGKNAEATVSFKLPSNSQGQIKSYSATSDPGNITATGSGSPITVPDLTNGTTYTFTVTATNKMGTSPPSDATNSITPATVPNAPTNVAAKVDKAEATVSFKPPASNGGSEITSYIVTSSGGQTGLGRASPIIVKGLDKGKSYTFTATAKNKIGTSPPSTASNSVVPQ